MKFTVYHILLKQVNANAIAFNTDPLGHNISVVTGMDKFYLETFGSIDNSDRKEGLLKELNISKAFYYRWEKIKQWKVYAECNTEVIELELKKNADAETKLRVLRESLSELNALRSFAFFAILSICN